MKRRLLYVFALIVVLFLSCSERGAVRDEPRRATADADAEISVDHDPDEESFEFELSEGEAPDEEVIRPRTVSGEPLDEEAQSALLSRLPALPDDEEEAEEFAFRDRSTPAPRTGATSESSFPPDDERERPERVAEEGAPEVTRYAPEGEVDVVPKVTVSFSRPMVALSGQDDAAQTEPATIEPEVDGAWRWIGTKTAVFEPEEGRFPKATDYTVTVDESLESAGGQKLESAAEFSFSTPPVQVERFHPNERDSKSHTGPQPLRPLMFLEFDQRVDTDEMLEHVRFETSRGRHDVVEATDDEIEGNDQVRRLVERAEEDRWIAFRPAEELPKSTDVTFGLDEGAPSAEGPRRTTEPQLESFDTYDELRQRRQNCKEPNPCTPGSSWRIHFNNPIDESAFDEEMVDIEPELPGADIAVDGNTIIINGKAKPRTAYDVTVTRDLRDKVGQTLGEDDQLGFHTGAAPSVLRSDARRMSILDPESDRRFAVQSVNVERIEVRAWRVAPEDWSSYVDYIDFNQSNSQVDPPGELVIDEVLDVENASDELVTTQIDLAEALNDEGHGHLILNVVPKEEIDDSSRRPNEVLTWVQSTDLAVDAFASGDETIAWVSELADGRPVDGARVTHHGVDGETDADGIATLSTSVQETDEEDPLLVAQRGDDSAMLTGHGGWTPAEERTVERQKLWHVFDDRRVYQPGETAHFKGWVRDAPSKHGDPLRQVDEEVVQYVVEDSLGEQIASGEAELTGDGGFDFAVDLPDSVNLGQAEVRIALGESMAADEGDEVTGYFSIQEFRRPEFEVSASSSSGPHVFGEKARVDLEANYYAGGGLAGADVKWTVESRQKNYTPPDRDDYVFGRWKPWWHDSSSDSRHSETFESHTDASGEHHLTIEPREAKPPLPHVLDADGAVTDVNRQTWSAAETLLVHPSRAYVGLRTERNFVGEGEPFTVDSIVSDIDGELLRERPVKIRAARLAHERKDGEWTRVERDAQLCEVQSAEKARTCEFVP
ncbi:MAG: Ig-like domain-containing protein, partial [Persicimonas sp.]